MTHLAYFAFWTGMAVAGTALMLFLIAELQAMHGLLRQILDALRGGE